MTARRISKESLKTLTKLRYKQRKFHVQSLENKTPRTLLLGFDYATNETGDCCPILHIYLDNEGYLNVLRYDPQEPKLVDHQRVQYIEADALRPTAQAYPEKCDEEFLFQLYPLTDLPILFHELRPSSDDAFLGLVREDF